MTSIWSNVAWLEDTSCHQVTLYKAQCLEKSMSCDIKLHALLALLIYVKLTIEKVITS